MNITFWFNDKNKKHMKKILFYIGLASFIIACNSKPTDTAGNNETKKDTTGMVQENDNVKTQPPSGGITINELYTNRKKYEGQIVRVNGKCVKLNNNIMNLNWIHIQDGSSSDEKQDLTITTTDEVSMGAIVAFEGKIALDKDFGAGYKYEIIMEEAHLLPQ
jgi:starvation-inducible outer membrane lipoprotein